MRITRVETIPISVPLKERFMIRSGRGGSHTSSPFLLVKLHTDAGHMGIGEVSCTARWSGEDQVTAAHFVNRYFAPLLIEQDPTQVEALTATFASPVRGNPFTKAGIEMALWDLAGKAAGKPVYELLGGKVRQRVATKWSVSGQPPQRAAEIARWAIDSGFSKMKVKVGIDATSDDARVGAVRGEVGSAVQLGVDANGGWATPNAAISAIHRLRAHDIYFAEQPIPEGDAEAMAQVRQAAGVPVVADESLYTITDAQILARHSAADAFSIYVGKAGGILPARRIAEFAHSVGIKCTIGSNLELGVASAAMTHLALATAGIDPDTYPCDIIGQFFYEDDVLAEPLPIVPGWAAAPDRPGLGVTLDDAKVEKYRVR